MFVNRLLMLADALERFEEDRKTKPEIRISKFDLQEWSNYSDVLQQDDNGKYYLPEGTCGTSACAVGYAMLLPEFHLLGLNHDEQFQPTYRVQHPGDYALSFYSGWEAVDGFFGITTNDSMYLFSDSHYGDDERVPFPPGDDDDYSPVRPGAVVKRIRQFVRDNGMTGRIAQRYAATDEEV